MGEELELFLQCVVQPKTKLDSFATAYVQMATPGSDSIASRTVYLDGEMTDFSADWLNMEEAQGIPGNLAMASTIKECIVDVKETTEMEIVKNRV